MTKGTGRTARRLAVALLLPLQALAGEVSVAVASNFSAPMTRIARDFERDTGHKAVLAFGATGQFHAQILHGAPFEVLLAADDRAPRQMEAQGRVVEGTRFTYAVGRLALWSRQPGVVDASGAVLGRGGFDRLAVADPKLAPYGVAAMETLEHLGLREKLAARIVTGASVAQAYKFVASGSAGLGFVALSQVVENGRLREGSAWIVPSSMHAPIRQDAVLLKTGRANPAAVALMAYLKGDKAREVIVSHGYER